VPSGALSLLASTCGDTAALWWLYAIVFVPAVCWLVWYAGYLARGLVNDRRYERLERQRLQLADTHRIGTALEHEQQEQRRP
jgi:hypothetical protein